MNDNSKPEDLERQIYRFMNEPALLIDLLNTGNPAPATTITSNGLEGSEKLPDLPGIYVVAYCDEEPLSVLDRIYYVGVSTVSIRKRWEYHHKLNLFKLIAKVIHQVSLVEDVLRRNPLGVFCWPNPIATADQLLSLERELIKKIIPPCNRLAIGRDRDSTISVAGNTVELEGIKPEMVQILVEALKTYSAIKKMDFS